MIYLDNAATTPIDERVLEAMLPYLKEQFGNPGAMYSIGRAARNAIDEARIRVAEFINAKPGNIVFTSGGSEANTLAIAGSIQWMKEKFGGKDFAVSYSPYEHESVVNAFNMVFRETHCFVTTPQLYAEQHAARELAFVSVMKQNNEVPMSNNVSVVAKKVHDLGALFHTDCVQAAGIDDIDVREIGCDYLSFSSHKIHGPKGVGALYVKDASKLTPIIAGSQYQEFGMRGGTENVAGIVGFGMACSLAKTELAARQAQVNMLRQRFVSKLGSEMAEIGMHDRLHFNGDPNGCKNSKVVSFRVDGTDAQSVVLALSNEGIYVSVGSACHGAGTKSSRVLRAIGLTDEQAHNTIRVSLSDKNTVDDIEQASKRIAACVKVLARR